MPHPPFPIRTECPPGACVCERDALLQAPEGDLRVLRLTREEEKRLVQRLENLASLADLRHMEQRLFEQLGVRLQITLGPNEVRTLRGIAILVLEQPGLCRKTRQVIPAAIKRSMERNPQIAWDLLDEGGLFSSA
jgi:Trp operon repressor